MIPVITVDGGAACGKGAVASALAQKLGFHYLDSGVFYRALGYLSLSRGLSAETPEDESLLIPLAQNLRLSFVDKKIYLLDEGETGKIDITREIRTEQASLMSSKVSMWQGVRTALLEAQRRAHQAPGLVAEGRDMGTVVFPQATVKFFLVCDLQVRAQRRLKQLENQGVYAKLRDLRQGLMERDARDSGRAVAPLKPASDAVMIDNTHQSLESVVAQCLENIHRAFAKMPQD